MDKLLRVSDDLWEDDLVPLLSIVCITYNHESYIKEAIDSFLAQQTKFKIEILVHDDASTDNTQKIIREYELKYPKIIKPIYQKENQYSKMGFAFSIAELNRSVGKYIALCEGDDYWTDSLKLHRQVNFLELYPSFSGAAHQSTVLYSNGNKRLFHKNVPEEITINDIIGKRIIHTNSIVFHRKVVDLINQAPIVLSGDRMIYFCIAITGRFKFFNTSMGVYRLHDKGMSSNADINKMNSDLKLASFLKTAFPKFPKYKYKAYVYATMGLSSNSNYFVNLYYISLSFLYSFSYFPRNIIKILRYIKKRL